MYDRVLVPTDGSDIAVVAAKTAFALARQFDSTLHVVHVLEDRDPTHGDRLVAAVEEVADDVNVETTTAVLDESTSVNDAIIDYVQGHGIDCIVMGTHGAAHPDRRVLGSVAERTIRTAPVPVVTVNEGTVLTSEFDTALIPTDGSARAKAAVDHGISLAAELDAAVHVIHIIRSEEDEPAGAVYDELEKSGRRAIDEAADMAKRSDVSSVEASVLTGVPYQAIVDYVQTYGVDFVCIGTHGRAGVSRHFIGSVTERVMRRVNVPVVAVTEQEPIE